MAKTKIIVKIEDGGIVTSEVFGVVGPGCDNIDKFLKAVGKVEDIIRKPEFYKKAGAPAHEQQRT